MERKDISDALKTKIMGENAAKLYGDRTRRILAADIWSTSMRRHFTTSLHKQRNEFGRIVVGLQPIHRFDQLFDALFG
jgi:hypothetical protein